MLGILLHSLSLSQLLGCFKITIKAIHTRVHKREITVPKDLLAIPMFATSSLKMFR